MIVVCGEALVDTSHFTDGTERRTPGGGPFNTARALARLGIPTSFLGRLSTDSAGRELGRLLSVDGVDLSRVSFGPEPTTVARATVGKDGSAVYRFMTDGTSAPNLTSSMLPPSLGADVTAIHVGSLGLVLEPMASTILELLDRERGRHFVMVDPNVRPSAIRDPVAARARIDAAIARSTIVKASEDDVAWLYPGLDLPTAAVQILAAGARLAVITLGARGALGITEGARVQVPAPAVEMVDTIGAGDAFGAALLAWLHEHEMLQRDLRIGHAELTSALAFACQAASLTCTKAGAEPPIRAELGA